jgi:hypothetical protein
MSKETVKAPQPEWLLAGLLRYGTGLATGVTGLGLALSLVGVEGAPVVAAGVALFIALPVLRVLVMLGAWEAQAFVRSTDCSHEESEGRRPHHPEPPAERDHQAAALSKNHLTETGAAVRPPRSHASRPRRRNRGAGAEPRATDERTHPSRGEQQWVIRRRKRPSRPGLKEE